MGSKWRGLSHRAKRAVGGLTWIGMVAMAGSALAEDVKIVHAGRLLAVPGERVQSEMTT